MFDLSILEVVIVSVHIITANSSGTSFLLHLLQLLAVIVLGWLVFVIACIVAAILSILRVVSSLIQRVTCSSLVSRIA